MKASELNDYVDIYEKSVTKDALGQSQVSYNLVASVPAQVRYRTTDEQTNEGVAFSRQQVYVKTRYYPVITNGHMLKHKGVAFNIIGVQPYEREGYMVLVGQAPDNKR